MPNSITKRDGSLDWSGGVNSVATTTLTSGQAPAGLKRNELAWLINGTVRDGGITQRWGWTRVGTVSSSSGLFQGKFVYAPTDADPYEIWVVSGHVLRVDLDTAAVTDLSDAFGLYNSDTEPHSYFVQANQFLVIQAGDNVTLPLFWDGTTLRRSNGLTGIVGGQPAATYNLTPTSFWVVPPVGGTVTVTMTAIPAGLIAGNQGTYGVIGEFLVTLVAGNDITFQTVTSDFVGANISAVTAPFTVNPTPAPANINEIPAATAMEYYGGRIWYALGNVVSAGDIDYGTSGTAAYNYRDAVLKVTENPVAIGGDGFPMPSQSGNIRAIRYGAAIDASLGQGRLFIFTRREVYSIQVPVNRQDWIDATAQNQPLVAVVQLVNGSVNDRSVVAVNGDLYYQSLEPGIRSLNQSVRYFTQAGNRSISANEQRILQFNDRSLLHAASGIYFDNRLLQTALPREVPQGIVHDAIVPLDFVPISTLNNDRPMNWEGMSEGIPIFQLSVADFGGRERAFAAALAEDGSMELWELTIGSRFDYADSPADDSHRIKTVIEFPAFTWAESFGELELKKLVSAEMWVDRLFGTVIFTVEYRPDGSTCWLPWLTWKECSPKNTLETIGLPIGYPTNLGTCYKATMVLPKPDPTCAPCNNGRPANIAYQFQPRLTILGFCRLRGFWLWAEQVDKSLYKGLTC